MEFKNCLRIFFRHPIQQTALSFFDVDGEATIRLIADLTVRCRRILIGENRTSFILE